MTSEKDNTTKLPTCEPPPYSVFEKDCEQAINMTPKASRMREGALQWLLKRREPSSISVERHEAALNAVEKAAAATIAAAQKEVTTAQAHTTAAQANAITVVASAAHESASKARSEKTVLEDKVRKLEAAANKPKGWGSELETRGKRRVSG